MKVKSLTSGEVSESKPPKPGLDKTPSLIDQAESNGWTAGEFNFGKAGDGAHHFNPTIVERADGLWLVIRRAVFTTPQDRFGMNSCWAFKLEPETLKPEVGYRLKFPEGSSGLEQFEDPRAVFQNGKTFVGAVNFIWYGNGEWTGARQVLGVFDDQWNCTQLYRPPFGGNSMNVEETTRTHQKNWCWWFHDNQLHLLYHSKPWRIAAIGKSFEDATPYESEGVGVSYGEIRGGTPPILVDGLYWTFFHSSLPWVDRFRRYHMGAIGFESKPPFKPVMVTPSPILTGSQNDYWLPRKPLVVFPGGALFKNGEWLIVYGVNDLKCGYCFIPHTDILKRAKRIDELSPNELLCDSRVDKSGSSRPAHNRKIAGSNPAPAKRKRGDAEPKPEHRTNSNGAAKVQPSVAPTVGDEIRDAVAKLEALATNQNRKTRILSALRKTTLLPRSAR
jgi:hypothetical protein